MPRFLGTVRVGRAFGTFGTAALLCVGGLDVEAGQGEPRRPPVLNFVGVTGHAWGTWVRSDVEVEDWVEEARGLCAPEEYCEVNVFEGADLATHEYPVPEANRAALKGCSCTATTRLPESWSRKRIRLRSGRGVGGPSGSESVRTLKDRHILTTV